MRRKSTNQETDTNGAVLLLIFGYGVVVLLLFTLFELLGYIAVAIAVIAAVKYVLSSGPEKSREEPKARHVHINVFVPPSRGTDKRRRIRRTYTPVLIPYNTSGSSSSARVARNRPPMITEDKAF